MKKFLFLFSILLLFGDGLFANNQYLNDPSEVKFINLNHHRKMGGHTCQRHCSKSDEYLKKRLKSGRYRVISTFDNKSSAEKSILAVIKNNKSLISKWWNSNRKKEAFFAKVKTKGRYITKRDFKNNPNVKSKKIDGLSLVRVVLAKKFKKKKKMWYVLTAFPDPGTD